MFSTICKLLFLYVVLSFLFSDLSSLKEPGVDFFAQQYEDVSRTAKKFANYVDDTVIPYVDNKFDEADLEKSLVGNLMDKVDIPSGQIQKEPFSVSESEPMIKEDTFFEDK